MPTLKELLKNNRAWAKQSVDVDPHFFERLADKQSPEYLWIGCADSRVPANQILGLNPGEVFVHRNIANLFKEDDANCLSVLQFAVDVLKVKHIIVTGHYGCGGVAAAMSGDAIGGRLGTWIQSIRDVHELHMDELHAEDPKDNLNRMCEFNVLDQTSRLSRAQTIQDAWARDQSLQIHSWVYSLEDGILKPIRDVISEPLEP